jgi:hypothetical protein
VDALSGTASNRPKCRILKIGVVDVDDGGEVLARVQPPTLKLIFGR